MLPRTRPRDIASRVKWKFNIATNGKRENTADNFRVNDIATKVKWNYPISGEQTILLPRVMESDIVWIFVHLNQLFIVIFYFRNLKKFSILCTLVLHCEKVLTIRRCKIKLFNRWIESLKYRWKMKKKHTFLVVYLKKQENIFNWLNI